MKKLFLSFFTIYLLFSLSSCLKPGDDEFHDAMKAYGKQRYQEALDLFQQAIDQDCNYSKEIIYSMMANVHLAQKNLDSAAECYEKALSSKPDYRLYTTLGSIYHANGKDSKAEESYTNAVNMDSSRPEAYASLGSLYLGQGLNDKAIEFLQKAEKINTKLAVVHANLAVAYATKKDSDSAQKELNLAEQYQCENLEQFKQRVQELLAKDAK